MNKLNTYIPIFPLFFCGLWFIGQGAYIHAKALLAQVLLESAWAETLHGNKEVKPWPWADTWPVSRLSVPALGVSRIVLAGASGQALAFGPGRLFYSVHAGKPVNIVIAGHRDTHFRFLKKINHGELIRLQTESKRILDFKVVDISVIDSRRIDLSLNNAGPMLTLITCYPFDAVRTRSPLRYMVRARLVGKNT